MHGCYLAEMVCFAQVAEVAEEELQTLPEAAGNRHCLSGMQAKACPLQATCN